MKMRYVWYALLVTAMTGCGSDNDSVELEEATSTEIKTTVETAPVITYENITVDVAPNEIFDQGFKVYIGPWFACDLDKYPDYCTSDGLNKVVADEDRQIIEVSAEEFKANYGESISSNLFADGHYSLLDVVLYLSQTRDDLDVQIEFDETLDTYKLTTSYDANNDGVFDINDGERNFQNPDWYPNFALSGGSFKRENTEPELERLYDRTEEFLVRDNMEIRFQSFSPMYTERRELHQRSEVEHLAANGGVITLDEIRANFGDGRGYVVVATDITVRDYNLRPDVLKPGTLTIADALMTAYFDGKLDVSFSYWPSLSTNTEVNAFALSGINGYVASGFEGWLFRTGAREHAADFFASKKTSPAQLLARESALHTKCTWIEDLTEEQAQNCYDDFGTMFGGNFLHTMTDTWVLQHPHEYLDASFGNQNTTIWDTPNDHQPDDGTYPVYDISQAPQPLTETHFGWKIADCSQCHAVDGVHLNGDSPTLPDTAEPYYCAQCHGSNGAPERHGEATRCYWCHGEGDQLMVNHGLASIKKRIDTMPCEADFTGVGSCVHVQEEVEGIDRNVHDGANNPATYEGSMLHVGNSEWHTDQQFPDPYSCVTCHTAPE